MRFIRLSLVYCILSHAAYGFVPPKRTSSSSLSSLLSSSLSSSPSSFGAEQGRARIDTETETETPVSEKPSHSRSQGLLSRQSSFCKYDLGLGKNAPVLFTNGRTGIGSTQQRTREEHEQAAASGSGSGSAVSDDNRNNIIDGFSSSSTNTNTYEACRFLVEHEATRIYPAPNVRPSSMNVDNVNAVVLNGEERSQKSIPKPSVSMMMATTTMMISSGKKDVDNVNEHDSKADATIKDEAVVATMIPPASRKRKSQPVLKVKPKRFLEDCLTILDHKHAAASKSASASASASASESCNNKIQPTIVSLPDSPQLDMNSVWVEMLLHNQMTLAQIKG